jgi:uncharacterized membrane protein (DUF106 family)
MTFLANLISWINIVTNLLGRLLLVLVQAVPGWLSNTILSAIAGVVLLILFKYTSDQKAIGKVRDDIKAHLLALKLYKDTIAVTLNCQGRVFRGAFLLLFHALRPMAVMMIPVSLLLAQLGLFYQTRPLLPGEEAVVTMSLTGDATSPWPEVTIKQIDGASISIEKTKVTNERQFCWKIKAEKDGDHKITFDVDGEKIEKTLAVGNSFMRVSEKRPGPVWGDVLMHPAEKHFSKDSPVQSISIDYPDRISKTCGTDWWIGYFFLASMVFAFIAKPFLDVKI